MAQLPPFLATSVFHDLTGTLVTAVTANRSARLIVRGESGLGKTTNLEHSIDQMADRFGLVLRARSHPLKLAYYPLADAIWSIADSAKRQHSARKLLLDTASDLTKLIPVLGPFAPDLTELLGTGAPVMPTGALEPLDVAFHMRRLLRQISKSKPVLLVFDNVHEFDTSTLSTLYCLFRDLPQTCCVVMASDPTAVGADDSLRAEFEDQIVEQFRFRRLELNPLTRDETTELAAMILRDAATEETAALVHRFTGGHPFFVVEVCAALSAHAVAADRLAEDTGLPLTERLSRFVDRRLRQITDVIRPTLDMAAVFGPAFPSLPIAACIGRDHVDVLRHLRALDTIHRMVRSSNSDRYQFTATVIRDRVYELLGRDVAREHHLLIARTLRVLSKDADWDYEIGRHLLLGGHTEEGLEVIRQSAATAANANRFGDAADRYQRLAAAYGSTRSDDIGGRHQALVDTIRCLREQGNIRAALAFCQRLSMERAIAPLVASRFAVEDAALAYYVDDFESCVAKSNALLGEHSDSLSLPSRVQARLTLSAALYHLGRWREARHHYRRCFAEPGINDDTLLLAQALKRANMFYIPELALPKLESIHQQIPLRASPDLRCQLLTNVGMNYLKFADYTSAKRYFDEAIEGFLALGSHKQTYPLNDRALAEMLSGEYSSARLAFARLVGDFSEEFERDCARCNEATCALFEGDVEFAVVALTSIWERFGDGSSPVLTELVGNNLGLALAAQGHAQEAARLIVATASRDHVSLPFERGRRHRVVNRLGGDAGFLKSTQADYDRLTISGRRDAQLYRDVDYEIGDLWFWE